MTIDSIKKNQTNEDNKKDDKVNTVDTLTKQIKHLTIGMCVLGIATGFSIFSPSSYYYPYCSVLLILLRVLVILFFLCTKNYL